jgi:ubiquinone/menaquinone biosynthesis C-methylase UbiE
MSDIASDPIHTAVREHYGAIARTRQSKDSCCSTGCCDSLYPADQLTELPSGVTDLSLGCGDPVSLADIREGDTVLDLGSGGGIDCFLAAKRVGPAGRVIGVDMTPEMLERARANAVKLNAVNVEFREGHIEALPVEDGTVDVIISNCVINLSPDKPRVFREMFRVLRSPDPASGMAGGRVAVSDIVTNGPMSPLVAKGVEAWSECLAGALDAKDYREGLEAAGFGDVTVTPKDGAGLAGTVNTVLAKIPAGMPFSAMLTARKPGAAR